MYARLKWVPKRVRRGCDEQGRRRLRLVAAHELGLIAKLPRRTHELDRVQVVHPARLRVVAHALVVARQAEHVADPERVRPEQIALQRDAIPVAASHLDHRLEPLIERDVRRGDARHPDHGRLVVRQVDGIDHTAKVGRLLADQVRVGALGRTHLAAHCEVPRPQDLL